MFPQDRCGSIKNGHSLPLLYRNEEEIGSRNWPKLRAEWGVREFEIKEEGWREFVGRGYKTLII